MNGEEALCLEKGSGQGMEFLLFSSFLSPGGTGYSDLQWPILYCKCVMDSVDFEGVVQELVLHVEG